MVDPPSTGASSARRGRGAAAVLPGHAGFKPLDRLANHAPIDQQHVRQSTAFGRRNHPYPTHSKAREEFRMIRRMLPFLASRVKRLVHFEAHRLAPTNSTTE